MLEINKIYNMDCLEGLKLLDDNSVDSIVTDPPYELGFMGKKWDSTGITYSIELWQECLRVLKPGGHLLSFGGTRTYHRMACTIEDVGFEIRDQIMWIYGSGFPKSMDISKAIDKKAGQNLNWFIDYILEIAEKRGIAKKELTMLFPSKNGKPTGWLWNKQKTQGITLEQYNKIKDYLNLPFETIEEAEREVIGTGKAGLTSGTICNFAGETEFAITTPATKQAQQWDGWGTALKPANEPIVLARKPISEKTIADNVLKWGTGGINIDGCRIGTEILNNPQKDTTAWHGNNWSAKPQKSNGEIKTVQGRFPANIIFDEEAGRLLDEQSGNRPSGKGNGNAQVGEESNGAIKPFRRGNLISRNDSGGASRFFYCAKASKKERGEGNKHPTVKPIKLIEYLITLITPPNGIVVDPFIGSGTTALASLNKGFNYIGFELDSEYFEIANKRIEECK